MTRLIVDPTSRSSLAGLALSGLASTLLMVACGSPPAPGIPPQAPSHLSGPAVDTSELAAPPQTSGEPVRLHILHTNDFHGQIKPRAGTWINKDKPPQVGGAHALAGYIDKVRADVGPDNLLLLDSGDIYAGTPEGDLTNGLYVVELMNALGYDAMALGNHEFDRGLEVLVGLGKVARFPILAANVLPRSNPTGDKAGEVVKAITVVERAGVKIGLVGVIAPNTPEMTDPFAAEAFDFGDPATAIGDAVGTLKAEGADLIIVLSHIGKEEEIALAAAAPEGVVAVLGGHSHTGLDEPLVADNGVVYMQSWGKGSGINHLELEIKGGEASVVQGRLVPLMAADFEPSDAVTALSDKYGPELDKIMNEKVGVCKEGLVRERKTISGPLGNFVTDVMRQLVKADLAITNKSGIRADIPPGDVTMRTLHNVAPFSNTIVTVELSGAQLQKLFEYAGNSQGKNRVEISGARVVYDLDKPEGKRVKTLEVGGKPINPKKTYKVATNSFLAGGGDGHLTFKEGKQKMSGVVVKEALADWFRKNKACAVDKKGRVLSNRP